MTQQLRLASRLAPLRNALGLHSPAWFCLPALVLLSSGARAQSTDCVSVTPGATTGSLASETPALSSDGRFVAFESAATDLVTGDTNGHYDVFVRDRSTGVTELATQTSGFAQANADSGDPSISADGRFVVFESFATNLVTGDTNGFLDIFVHDRQTGLTQRVSVSTTGAQADQNCLHPSISADGRFVSFDSAASTLVAGDTNGVVDVFVRDLVAGTTERVSVGAGAAEGNGPSGSVSGTDRTALSSDGRFVAFRSQATNLVAGDTNNVGDIFIRDRLNATTEMVSVTPSGQPAGGESSFPAISADGRFVAFKSGAQNLVAGAPSGVSDIYARDRLNGTTERISVSSAGTFAVFDSFFPAISADGRYVAFNSSAPNLVAGDSNGAVDVFLRDRLLGTTEIVSIGAGGIQANGNCGMSDIAISADGHSFAFECPGSSLYPGDTNGANDVFVRGAIPPTLSFCRGDGSLGTCPCANNGTSGRGCQNSAATGGAVLSSAGNAALSSDTLSLTSSGELSSVLSIFLQGDTAIVAVSFGDGLRCAGGTLKRLFTRNASGGVVSAPPPGGPSISARSAVLGDVISTGSTRYYQTYYRDPLLTFCPSPQGSSFNISSGLAIVWGQ